MPRAKQEDNALWLVGAGILSVIAGVAGTLMFNNSGPKKNNNRIMPPSSSPPKKGCGCGLKKH